MRDGCWTAEPLVKSQDIGIISQDDSVKTETNTIQRAQCLTPSDEVVSSAIVKSFVAGSQTFFS